MMAFYKDVKNIVILLLLVLFALAVPEENLYFIMWAAIGIFTASLFDFLLHCILYRKKIIPKRAIISGFIVAGIINYHEPLWLLIVFILFAIASKHFIRINHRHFLNPANAALALATFFDVPMTWSLESNAIVLMMCGIYFVYRINKWGHVLSFLAVFASLFYIKGINPLLMMSWFFVYIMLIEPKTSGNGLLRGIIFGTVVGIVSFFIYAMGFQNNFFVLGLLAANLCNPLLDMMFAKISWIQPVSRGK